MSILNFKRIVGKIIIAFALISLGVAIGDLRAQKIAPSEASSPVREEPPITLVLYRGGGLCPTCDVMESLTKEIFSDKSARIAPLVDAKDITFDRVDLEKPGNEHFFDDYDLYTTTLVLSYRRGGREVSWKSLPDGWKLSEKPAAFKKYVEDEITSFARSNDVSI